MPAVLKNESQKAYVSRCVPIVIEEGTATSPAQAAAICNSMYRTHHRKDKVLSLSANDSDSIQVENVPLEYWKECIPVGPFVKGGNHFNAQMEDLEHWKNTGKMMLSDGFMIPVPVEHTKNPELRRGEVKDFDIRKNKKGIDSLYAKIAFNDAKTALQLSKSGTSIFVPEKVCNSAGKEYVTPIQHVAITDYPVLNGLEPFVPIILSYGTPATLRGIADMLGVPPTVTDTQELIDAIFESVGAGEGGEGEAESDPNADPNAVPPKPGTAPGTPPGVPTPPVAGAPPAAGGAAPPPAPTAGAPSGAPGTDPQIVHVNTPMPHTIVGHIVRPVTPPAPGGGAPPPGAPPAGGKPPFPPKPGVPPAQRKPPMGQPATSKTPQVALSQNIVETLKNARKVQLDHLLAERKVTPAVYKRLSDRYLTDVALQMSNEYDDGFNDVVADYEANEPINSGKGKTGIQGKTLALSKDGDDDLNDNPLIRDAEKRAKAARGAGNLN